MEYKRPTGGDTLKGRISVNSSSRSGLKPGELCIVGRGRVTTSLAVGPSDCFHDYSVGKRIVGIDGSWTVGVKVRHRNCIYVSANKVLSTTDSVYSQ